MSGADVLLNHLDSQLRGDVDGDDAETTEILPPEPMEMLEVKTSLPKHVLETDQAQDYIKARQVYHTLINKATTSLNGVMEMAHHSASPLAYKQVVELTEVTRKLTVDLIGLQKSFKELLLADRTFGDPSKGDEKGDEPKYSPSKGESMKTTDLLQFAKAAKEQLENDKTNFSEQDEDIIEGTIVED